ncbi:hypothetical protein KI387_044258 [Taxus chinensis]|uniref:Uncharacterized protein n=1 Tax=Taxus chinensis TaxID=29808 RepID=A0AA38FBN1_TAXCH|nr:hypothetical protein KI387_044258 [Taxus chinensis]
MDDGDGVVLDSADAGQEEETFPQEIIATLSSTLMYKAFRIRGVMQGQRVVVLIDSGATHNFIDASLVERWGLQTEDFEGFNVVVANGESMRCTRWVPQVSIMMGNYTVTNDFHIVGMGVTNIVLGVQWLHSLGEFQTNFQMMELKFKSEGRNVILRGLSIGAPRVVTAEGMERNFQHDEGFYYCGSMWSMMDVDVTSSVAHETVIEIGDTGSDHLSLSLCWLSKVSVDWRSHFLVEYSKNRHTCEILDGHIQDDTYRLEDEMIFYQDRLYLVFISERFRWHGLREDILNFIQGCTVCRYNKSELTGSSCSGSALDNTPMYFIASGHGGHFTHVLVSGGMELTQLPGYSVGYHSSQEVNYVELTLSIDHVLESWDFSPMGHIEIHYEELYSHTNVGHMGELARFVWIQVISQVDPGDSTGFRVDFCTQELIGERVMSPRMMASEWQGLDKLAILMWVPVESQFGYHSTSQTTFISIQHGGHDDYMGVLGYFGLHLIFG